MSDRQPNDLFVETRKNNNNNIIVLALNRKQKSFCLKGMSVGLTLKTILFLFNLFYSIYIAIYYSNLVVPFNIQLTSLNSKLFMRYMHF